MKVRIYLADLTHTGNGVATEVAPLNIGLIGSYVKKTYGDDVEISLFKFADSLLEAMTNHAPHILGVSNYAWNPNLSEWACRKAKEISPGILTVKGGWNFPLDDEERLAFLLRYSATDAYVPFEGELPFAALVGKYLSSGREGVLANPVDGCVYVDRSIDPPVLVTGRVLPRISDLDVIPSPFRNGMMDGFLNGRLIPIIETTRGCPFSCNYCNSAHSYYSKVRAFSLNYIREDLDYLCGKFKNKANKQLMIPDANFGMFDQDKLVVESIADMREKHGWPQLVYLIGSGKKKMDKVLLALQPIKDILAPSLSFQTFNDDSLREIKRANVGTKAFKLIAKKAENYGFTIHSELIAPLPHETLASYFKGVEMLMDCGPKKITSYTLQMNHGTVYRQKEYVKKHGYLAKYRLVPNDFGLYGGDLVFETEMVAVASDCFSFDDYMAVRCFTLYTELFYNNNIFHELMKYLGEWGFTKYDFMVKVRDNFSRTSRPLSNILKSFISDTKNEIKNSEEEFVHFYAVPEHYNKLKQGTIGGNVIFKHKVMVLCEHIQELITFAIHCANELIMEKAELSQLSEHKIILGCIYQHTQAVLFDVFDDRKIDQPIVFKSNYDILKWINDKEGKPLRYFKKETIITYSYSEEQKIQKKNYFEQYGRTSHAKTKILAKVAVLHNLFRQPS